MSTQHNLENTKTTQASTNSSRWLTRFLEAKAFLKLPAKNLQEFISQLQEINITAGETIINAGESNEFFYIVKQGSLDLSLNGQSITTLGEGEGFGEDILAVTGRAIFDVHAHTDSTLMRLSKANFKSLLLDPVVTIVETLPAATKDTLIDSNTTRTTTKASSLHIPYTQLRLANSKLNKKSHYFITNQDTGLSKAGAFTLSQLGYTVSVVEYPADEELSEAINLDASDIETDFVSELSEIEQQIKSLETMISSPDEEKDTPNDTISAPKNSNIKCVERDDERLWTPIPSTEHLSQETLSIIKTAEEKNPLATAKNSNKKPNANWLSDEYVWENVLGFDRTQVVDDLIEAEVKENQKSAATNTPTTAKNTNPFTPKQLPPNAPAPKALPKPQQKVNNTTAKAYTTIRAKRSKMPAIITVSLAITISALPFAFPNTWNHYYSLAGSYVAQGNFGQLMAGLVEPTPSHNAAPLANPPKTPNITEQKQLAQAHMKSQAQAEFSRKLAAAKPIAVEPAPLSNIESIDTETSNMAVVSEPIIVEITTTPIDAMSTPEDEDAAAILQSENIAQP